MSSSCYVCAWMLVFGKSSTASTKPFWFPGRLPGPGLGGHCIPVEPFYLSWKAKQLDFRPTRFIELASEFSDCQQRPKIRSPIELRSGGRSRPVRLYSNPYGSL